MRRRIWATQPPDGTPIDWDCPLAAELVDVIDMRGFPRSVLLNTPATFFGTSQQFGQPTAQGQAFDTLASYAGVSFARSDSAYANLNESIVFVGALSGFTGQYAGIFASADQGGTSNRLTFQYSGTPGEYSLAINNTVLTIPVPIILDVPYVITATVTWTGNAALYLNGALEGTVSSTPPTLTGSKFVIFGERTSSVSYATKGTSPLALIYGRTLNATDAWEISKNPWQIFHRRRRFYSIATSGGSTITGSAAVDESSDIAAGSGGISIAGAGATTEGADTASGAGTVSIAGAASAAESADTASAAGTAGSSITGSGAAAEGADTGAGTGAVSISGAGAATEQRDSAGGAGSISVSATGAVHEGADAAAAAGSLSISGAANATEGTDKAAGTGSATGTLGAPGSIPSVARYTIRRQVARNFTVWRSVSRNFAVRRSLVRVFEVNSVSLRFPVKGPLEAVPLTFDFSADLPSGVTLSGAPTMSIACTEGTDANAANVISGSVALNAAKTGVVQDGTGGLDGCEYTITCTCATTQSNLTLTLVGILAVRANLN